MVVVAHKIEERPSNVDFRFQLTTETETIFEYSKVINKFPSHSCPATLTRIRSFKVRVCVCHLRYYTRSWWRWPSVSVSPVALRDDGPSTAFFVCSCCYCFPFYFEAFIVLCLCGGYCKTVVRPFGQDEDRKGHIEAHVMTWFLIRNFTMYFHPSSTWCWPGQGRHEMKSEEIPFLNWPQIVIIGCYPAAVVTCGDGPWVYG